MRPASRLRSALFVGLAAFLGLSSAPHAQEPTSIAGLAGDGWIVTDTDGVPHVCGGDDRDTMLLLGWVHARDRLFQMDAQRRRFSGTLAALLGEGALGSDVQFRTFGLRRAAEATLAGYAENGLTDTLGLLEAYAAGVNAYLAANEPPPEYAALELTEVAPWTPVDSLVVGKGLAFGLSFNLLELDLTVKAQAYAAAGAVAGIDGTALLFADTSRSAPFDATVVLPGGLAGNGIAARSLPATMPRHVPDERLAALAARALARAASVPALRHAVAPADHDTGSNWWLIAPEQSANGHAMLANDPHLALDTPATFYEAHLLSSATPACGLDTSAPGAARAVSAASGSAAAVPQRGATGLDVTGVTFPGVPGVVLGCSRQACWGATVNPMDVTDVYQETLVLDGTTGLPTHTVFRGGLRPILPIPETFLVNQIGDERLDNRVDAGLGPLDGGITLVIPERNNAPIISIDLSGGAPMGLSVQYTGWRDTYELEAFLRFARADSPAAFRDALQFFDVGSQNFAYADIDGNIAYFTSAELPLREDLQDLGQPDGGIPPFLIRDGTGTLRHEWLATSQPEPQQALGFAILPFAEMPQSINPEAGFIISANNDPVGTSLDNDPLNQLRPGGGLYYLNPGYVSLRAGRIHRALLDALGQGPVDLATLKAIQANNQLLDAELMMPHVLGAFTRAAEPNAPPALADLAADPRVAEAVARLAVWRFSSPTGVLEGFDPGDDPDNLTAPSAVERNASVATTLWSVWRGQAVQSIIDAPLEQLGLGDALPASRQAYGALANLLETFDSQQGVGASGLAFFPPRDGLDAAQVRDLMLLESLADALDLLASDTFAPAFGGSTNQDDYVWGALHRIVFDHPLGGPFSVPPAGGFADFAPGLPGIARAGGYEAVDASTHSSRADDPDDFQFGGGPARRFVGILDPAGVAAEEILPGGQRPVLGDPDYAGQLGRWLTNAYHPLRTDPDAIAASTVDVAPFTGGCAPAPDRLCLLDRRFDAQVTWSLASVSGIGQAAAEANASGTFYFFRPGNWEVLVKVLDGCAVNGHFWLFTAGATNLPWDLSITDTVTGAQRDYAHGPGGGGPSSVDIRAFPCAAGAAGAPVG